MNFLGKDVMHKSEKEGKKIVKNRLVALVPQANFSVILMIAFFIGCLFASSHMVDFNLSQFSGTTFFRQT